MSLGYCGFACLAEQNDDYVIYLYGCSNLNYENHLNSEQIKDGLIIINKNYLLEPEIHRKLKRFPHGRKRIIVKYIPIDIPYEELIASGEIVIENSKNYWKTTFKDVDFIAVNLIRELFNDYQTNGCLPEKVSFFI